ncbi:hypothetical protein GQ457_02G031060 [Hibiscus cannabinus]
MDSTNIDSPSLTEHSTVSFNALVGYHTPTTLRVHGTIHGKRVRILIDGGSTHNSIQSHVAKHLGLPVTSTPNFTIVVGNGQRLQNEDCARDVTVSVQGTELVTIFYILPLEGAEVVLGVVWMATLGPVTMDFSKLTFEFTQGKLHHCWQGEIEFGPQEIHLQSLRRLSHIGAIAEFFRLHMEEPQAAESPDLPVDLHKLLTEFASVFDVAQCLPPQRDTHHAIHLDPSSKPVNVHPYRYPHFQKEEIEKQVRQMLEVGHIRKRTSHFPLPVLLVRKKDGTWHFCVDYRALNAITIRDKFPIPIANELFDELGHSHYFSKLDLWAGYHQIRVRTEDVHKTAFRTHDGHYELLVMPFGLTNAPSTFQAIMNDIFRPYLRKFILIFLDDILVFSATWFDHLQHLRMVLKTLQLHGFVAKISKCSFGQQSVEYLGHVVSCEGLSMDSTKIEAKQRWSVPSTIRDICAFL